MYAGMLASSQDEKRIRVSYCYALVSELKLSELQAGECHLEHGMSVGCGACGGLL